MKVGELSSRIAAEPAAERDVLASQLAAQDRQVADLTAEAALLRERLARTQSELCEARKRLDDARDGAREMQERLQRQVQQAANELHAMQSSRGWQFILHMRRLRLFAFPPGSRRDWIAKRSLRLLRRIARAIGAPSNSGAGAESARTDRGAASGAHAPQGRTIRLPENAAAKLAPLRALAEVARATVIFPPSVGWSINLIQRPHHLARALTREGYAVVFDCTTAHDAVDVTKQIEPGLFLFNGRSEWLGDLPRLCLWTFSYNYHYRDLYPESVRVIYDWIDDLAVFPTDRTTLQRLHARALREADVVAAAARSLAADAQRDRPDAIYLPNAVEPGRFESEPQPNPARSDPALGQVLASGRSIAGYYGALAEWFDYPLLIAVAQQRPDWHFVLIGPDHDQSVGRARLARIDNITWLGPRRYHALPGYLHLFDVALIPFRINDITKATSPLKLYEYFAAGKPVVATPMPECMAHPEVQIAGDASAFAAALDTAKGMAADPAFARRLREVAQQNTWQARARTAFSALQARRPWQAEPPPLRMPSALGAGDAN